MCFHLYHLTEGIYCYCLHVLTFDCSQFTLKKDAYQLEVCLLEQRRHFAGQKFFAFFTPQLQDRSRLVIKMKTWEYGEPSGKQVGPFCS